jgi:hypothetical protein
MLAKLISYKRSYWRLFQIREKFQDIKVVIISRKSKDKQHKDRKKKDRRTDNDLQTITQNNKERATRVRLKTGMLRQGKKFLLHMWHLSCYSCCKPGDKSWMKKRPDCDFDKWSIFVVIWDTDIRSGQQSCLIFFIWLKFVISANVRWENIFRLKCQ